MLKFNGIAILTTHSKARFSTSAHLTCGAFSAPQVCDYTVSMRSLKVFFVRRRRWLIALLLLMFSCVCALRFGGGSHDFKQLVAGLAGLLGGLAIIGLSVACRQAWVLPPILKRAELMWTSGTPVAQVLIAAEPLAIAVGEIGYRGLMLRSWACFASGQRDIATKEAALAHLVRKPWWIRWPVRLCARSVKLRRRWPETLIVALAPDLPHVCWLRFERAIDAKDKESDALGWKLLLDCVPYASDDPLFLEACMMRALERLALNQSGGRAPISGPEARALLERSMTLLISRHSDPRLPWNRGALAEYLMRERRHGLVLALCGVLPPAFRSVDLWLAETRAWGELGDSGSAWKAIDDAVRVHPASYKLWMESYRIAMSRGDGAAARRSLEHASKCIGKQGAGPDRWEYELARSEYFFWVEGKTDAAWTHLAEVPEKYVENYRPKFTAQMLLAKNSFEEAYNKISGLLKANPNDVDLRLMQSEAMAGMGAWEALLPHLDSMGDNVRERAGFWYLKGVANKRLSNHGRGREDLERAAWMESLNLRYILEAGYACIELGEYERSEQHWRRALKLDPHNKEALLRLAESREMHSDIATAKSLLRECLVHHPDFQVAQEMLLKLETN